LPQAGKHLVPFTKSAEWTIPGKPLYYATAMPRRYGAMPLVVSTVDGRPSRSKATRSILTATARPTLLRRHRCSIFTIPRAPSGSFRHNKLSDRAAFEKFIAELRPKLAANGGAGLAFLVEETHSPTRERLRVELQKQFPGCAGAFMIRS
jgi:molybdopterin-containing oxidoreductase family iron-sulfur binding subunit